jgi:hypothetical protein
MAEYSYTPLDPATGEIRLLSIKTQSENLDCHLRIARRDNVVAFQALSYVWGVDPPGNTITLNGRKMQIRRSLASALRYFRNNCPGEEIWCDALCINQKDIKERNVQVARMGEIYRSATRVIIWLGEECQNSDIAIDYIKLWAREYPVMEGFHTRERDRLFDQRAWKALADLFERAWWWRIWTLPEIVLARTAILVCGSRSCQWDDYILAYAAWRGVRVPKVLAILGEERRKMLRCPRYDAGTTAMALRHARHRGQREDLYSLICRTGAFQCTESQDRVYALLGLSEGQEADIQVDYAKKIPEVYADLVRALAQDGNLSTLVHAGIGIRTPGIMAEQPSWIPDLGNMSTTVDPESGFAAGAREDPRDTFTFDSNVLSVQGVIVTTIDQVEKHEPEDSWRRTKWIRLLLSQINVNHPTGLPQLQVYFRTLICDRKKRAVHLQDFDSAEDATDFYDLAVGFLYIVSHVERENTLLPTESSEPIEDVESSDQSDNSDEDLESLSDYVNLFAAWTGRVSRHLSEQDILEPFLGPANSPLRLHWPGASGPRAGFYCLEPFLDALGLLCRDSSFFVSRSGYMGLCPPGTREGDLVCVVLGCDMPLVLRPYEEGYQLVGRSYVYGIMHGEAVESMRSPSKLRTFRLI